MRKDKLINYRKTVTRSEISIDALIHALIKKHDEILENEANSGIKAVAFNFIYNVDGRLIDICDLYVNNHKEIENILIANKFSSAVMANTTFVDQFYSTGVAAFQRKRQNYINIKYLIISKRGTNKSKLTSEQIYFYNHLHILMMNKLSFDGLLEPMILNQLATTHKWTTPINPFVDINYSDSTLTYKGI